MQSLGKFRFIDRKKYLWKIVHYHGWSFETFVFFRVDGYGKKWGWKWGKDWKNLLLEWFSNTFEVGKVREYIMKRLGTMADGEGME